MFPWNEPEVSPTPGLIKDTLRAIPDGKLRATLNARRRNGCDKYYGLTLRVPQGVDLRRFPSIPRATPQFETRYKGRTSVERVNDRLKVGWGLDAGNVVGARRSGAHVGAVLIVHLAFATLLAKAQRYEGSFGTMKLSPIATKLCERIGEKDPDLT
ncbi:hypothetical protein [Frigoriglobus tundricola]|uniref:Transposase DDE domain-containing protein n=1 Tax=Frigoriglobus tundricola TaxID=2774151 RepID=A0A6M5YU90_9BACT|nr:hypothetical protein [Frigoriglobus tundricola]QJW96482.1 hypothetical protein FTUN_4039 [Frigoriglobus tundricola]